MNAGEGFVRRECDRKIERKAINEKEKGKSRNCRKKKRDEDSIFLEISSEYSSDSTLSYSKKKLPSKHSVRNANHHMGRIHKSESVSNFTATETIIKIESSESFAQTEDLERNIGVQADFAQRISTKTHRHQSVQTDFGIETLRYSNESIKRNDFKNTQSEKNIHKFQEPPLTDISTLYCNPFQKKEKSNKISNLEERAYRLSRWLSEDKNINKSNSTKTFPKMENARKNVSHHNYSIPNISNYFEENRVIQKHNSPENYSSVHDIDSHFNILETFKAPMVIHNSHKDAVVQTDQTSNNTSYLIPEFKSSRQIQTDSSRRSMDRLPPELEDSPIKPIDHEVKRNMFHRTDISDVRHSLTNVHNHFHSDSSPPMKRTVHEIARILEKKSPIHISPLKKFPQNILRKYEQRTEKNQNSAYLQSKEVLKCSIPQTQQNEQIQKNYKSEVNNHRVDHGLNKAKVTGHNPSIKSTDRLQCSVGNNYSPEEPENQKLYSILVDGKQDVHDIKATEAYPKIQKRQHSPINYNKTDSHYNPISQTKYDQEEKYIKSDYDSKTTNFKFIKAEDKHIANTNRDNTLLKNTDQVGFAELNETEHDKMPVWKRAQLFSKVVNENDLAETGGNLASEKKEPDTLAKPGPIRVKKKFSNYLKGQYRNLEDETVGKSYMMIQDLKEVLQKRGIAN
ncbi:hypothetical protein HNY73_004143 [Argiope bruennichi]|uniref:Uncharacterized protein n=1 Tax=Argiope bruennichi TaxID=94029 RepID=A0A8T0FUX2_ARGBR|nr:hypothetical protein HNY73_004143 [Argiope bruennichi]